MQVLTHVSKGVLSHGRNNICAAADVGIALVTRMICGAPAAAVHGGCAVEQVPLSWNNFRTLRILELQDNLKYVALYMYNGAALSAYAVYGPPASKVLERLVDKSAACL